MERFRSGLLEDSVSFLNMISELVEKYGLTLGGEEYKRKKPCPEPELETYFIKKGLSLYTKVSDPEELFSHRIAEHTAEVFRALQPMNDYFHEIVEVEELSKAILREEKEQQKSDPEPEINMVKAPDVEFMW